MRTSRQTHLRRALLTALSAVPEGYLLPEPILRADAPRMVPHLRATTAEWDAEIRGADAARLILGVTGEDATKWKITDAGRAWLAENP